MRLRYVLIIIVLVLFASACEPSGQKSLSLEKVVSKSSVLQEVRLSVDARNCNLEGPVTISCSAGSQNQLSLTIGASAGVAAGPELIIDGSVSEALGISLELNNAQQLTQPPAGTYYHYTYHIVYDAIQGIVQVTDQAGKDMNLPFLFQSKCEYKIDTVVQFACDDPKMLHPTPVSIFGQSGENLTQTPTPSPTAQLTLTPDSLFFTNLTSTAWAELTGLDQPAVTNSNLPPPTIPATASPTIIDPTATITRPKATSQPSATPNGRVTQILP